MNSTITGPKPQLMTDLGIEGCFSWENEAAFLADTAAIHKGTLPRSRNRLCFQALYVMMPDAKIAPTPVHVPGFYDKAPEGLTMEQFRYVNRLVIHD